MDIAAATNLSQATPRMRDAAQRLEGQFLSMMLKPMFDTVRNARGTFGGGAAEEQWQPMMTDALANNVARAGGIGIRDMVLRHMIQVQANATATATQESRP